MLADRNNISLVGRLCSILYLVLQMSEVETAEREEGALCGEASQISLPSAARKGKKRRKRKGKVCVGMTRCPRCKKALAYSSVTAHMQRKHPRDTDREYTCDCGATFTTLAQRHSHYISVHGHQTSGRKTQMPTDTELLTYLAGRRKFRPKAFEPKDTRHCHICKKRCKNRRAYLRHRRMYHVEDEVDSRESADSTPASPTPVAVEHPQPSTTAACSSYAAKAALASAQRKKLEKYEVLLCDLKANPDFHIYFPKPAAGVNVSSPNPSNPSLLDALWR